MGSVAPGARPGIWPPKGSRRAVGEQPAISRRSVVAEVFVLTPPTAALASAAAGPVTAAAAREAAAATATFTAATSVTTT